MRNTRDRILQHLLRSPRATVDALAQSLELAPMTIRQHLANLSAAGLVEAATERRPLGRPAHVYVLTPEALEQFPKAYDRLASLLLEAAAETSAQAGSALPPGEGRAALLERIACREAQPHLASLEGMAIRDRAVAVTAIMNEESGFTELEAENGTVTINEFNCIYQRVAVGHNEVCDYHVHYVAQLMGASVNMQACQRDGAPACRFAVQGEQGDRRR